MAIRTSRNAWQPLQSSHLRPREAIEPSRNETHGRSDPINPPFARKPLPLPKDSVLQTEVVKDPEIVEMARVDETLTSKEKSLRPSPSVSSRYSTIFDLYMRDNTPVNSPELPLAHDIPSLPKIDASLGRFDFGLSRSNTTFAQAAPGTRTRRSPDAMAGAERAPTVTIAMTPPSRPRLSSQSRSQYSLFPTVDQSPPPTTAMARAVTVTSCPATPMRIVTPGSRAPYRPRKDSLQYGGRVDNLYSQGPTAPIPLRLLKSPLGSAVSSPIEKHRWTDDPLSSPVTATTSRGRASSVTTPRKDSAQYPLSFFEDDDDEAVPLRKKLGWARSSSSSYTHNARKAKLPRRRIMSVLLCCCSDKD